MERTLAILKPDVAALESEVVALVNKRGFEVIAKKRVSVSHDVAADFADVCADLSAEDVAHLASGPSSLLVLQKKNAVQDWLDIVGPSDPAEAKQNNPESLRAKYGLSLTKNAFHASATAQAADEELRFFFPDLYTQNIPTAEQSRDFLESALYPTLVKGLTELCKNKPANPTAWLGHWLIQNNPNRPQIVQTPAQ